MNIIITDLETNNSLIQDAMNSLLGGCGYSHGYNHGCYYPQRFVSCCQQQWGCGWGHGRGYQARKFFKRTTRRLRSIRRS